MGKKKKKISFDEFYESIYGKRWEKLKEAFSCSNKKYKTLGPSIGFAKEYFLDEASFVCTQSLNPMEGDSILDMCAAPGGKSLSLWSLMNFKGAMVSNDRSNSRRMRLKKVLSETLPELNSINYKITGHDAAKWLLYEKNAYDKILLDAPCSSEEHVYNSPKHLKQWTPNRTKTLAQTQYAMLLSALEVVKTGGEVLYSTCSISPQENDKVIERVLKKKKASIQLEKIHIDYGEVTEYGWQIFPDKNPGMGPIFFSKIKRLD